MKSQTQGSVCDFGNCQPQIGANGRTLLVALERFNTAAFFQFPDLISWPNCNGVFNTPFRSEYIHEGASYNQWAIPITSKPLLRLVNTAQKDFNFTQCNI